MRLRGSGMITRWEVDEMFKRKKLFVDRRVQGALIVRCLMYWVFCLITVTLLLTCWRILSRPPQLFHMHFSDLWVDYGPALIASFLLLPIVLLDSVRLSHKFAGPMLRMRRAMSELAAGRPVEPVYFRENDFWGDFAEDFNVAVKKLQARNAPENSESLELVGSAEGE